MMLAGDDITKVNEVLEQPIEEVLLFIKYQSDKAIINQKRQDILEAKSKRR